MDLKNTGLVLTLWDIGFGLEKYWDSFLDSKWFYMLELAFKILELSSWIWIDFMCLWYIALGLEQHSALGQLHCIWFDFTKHWA